MHCGVCEMDVPAGKFCGLLRIEFVAAARRRATVVAPARIRRGARRTRADAVGGQFAVSASRTTLSTAVPNRPARSSLVAAGGVLHAEVAGPADRRRAHSACRLFHIYLLESDAYEILSRRAIFVISVVSVALGVGWGWSTGAIIARSYAVAFGADMEFEQPLWEGIVIPVGGRDPYARADRGGTSAPGGHARSARRLHDRGGGALSFIAAATLTRLAPQFETGLTASDLPVSVLMIEAGDPRFARLADRGSAGGAVGAALWFTARSRAPTPRGKARQPRVVSGGCRGCVRRAGADRRVPRFAVLGAGGVRRRRGVDGALAARRAPHRTAARNARPDHSRTAAVRQLRPRGSRHGVLPGLRGRHPGVVTNITQHSPREPTRSGGNAAGGVMTATESQGRPQSAPADHIVAQGYSLPGESYTTARRAGPRTGGYFSSWQPGQRL